MRTKSLVYRGYLIKKHKFAFWNDGFNAFIGFTPVFMSCFPTINRVKIAIDLWIKFHMDPPKFWKYAHHLLVTNRHNYSGVYGKLITVTQLKKFARRA